MVASTGSPDGDECGNEVLYDTEHPLVGSSETPPVALADGGYERDAHAIIDVDWHAVENALGGSLPEDLRHAIEREGSASRFVLDKWGYVEYDSTTLFGAVEAHSRLRLSGEGVVPDRYVSDLSGIRGPLRVDAFDADLNTAEPVADTDKDGIRLVEGLHALVTAAEAIDAQQDEWYTHPTVGYGSYGPDALGNAYIRVGHTDESVLRAIDTEDLPVAFEGLQHWPERSHTDDVDEHYIAVFQHERYDNARETGEATDYGEYGEQAEAVGVLGANLGTTSSITAAFTEQEYAYEEVDELDVRGNRVTVYEYEKAGETRWAAEWSERVKIDEILWTSLVFEARPDEDAVSQAALIEEARREQ